MSHSFLSELDSNEDPIWFFFNSQFKAISQEIEEILKCQTSVKYVDCKFEPIKFNTQIRALYECQFESVFGK